MDDDKRSPYKAPAAKLADPAPTPGSPYKAVGLGVLTDFGGTLIFTNAVAFIYGVALAASGTPQEEIVEAITAVSPDSWYFWVATIGGGACSVAGGYVCAHIARQSEYTLGAILSVINVVLGLVIGGGGQDAGLSIVLNAATVASVMVGAWIGKKRNRAAKAALQ